MNEEKYTLIQDYFNDLLDEPARQQVLDLVKTDKEFAGAFHLHETMEKWPAADARRQQFSEQLTALGDEFFGAEDKAYAAPPVVGPPPPAMRVTFGRRLAIAAAVVVLLAAVWFVSRPQRLDYQQYALHEPLHITTRGNDAADISAAEQAYNSKNYPLALEKIRSVRQEKPDDLTLQLSEAVCLIELKRGAEARALLAPIAGGVSALRYEAVWYTGLSYLAENNLAKCKSALSGIPADDFRYKKAQEIIGKIK